jgi:heptosyltransferase II
VKIWTRIEQNFKRNGLKLLEFLLGKKQINPEEVDLSKINRILVIRQHDQLGDFLLSTPVLKALRQFFPSAFIAVLVRSYTEPVARHNQFINEVITLNEVGYNWTFSKIRTFWKQLRKGYDLTVVINTVSHSLSSDILAWFSGAKYILGPSHRIFPGTNRNFFYNFMVPFLDDQRHQSEKNLDIVRYLGINSTDQKQHITVLPEEKKWVGTELKKLGFDLNQIIVGIHPGAGKLKNRWPVQNFVEISQKLVKELNAQILLFHGPNETGLRDQFLSSLKVPVFFDKDLRKIASVFSCLSFFIGNDTGTTHMVAAVGVPLVVVFGPTSAAEWKPWGKEFVALQGQENSCENVSVDDVYTNIKMIVQK